MALHELERRTGDVRIGVLLPTRDRLAAGEPELRPLLELARLAESVGLDSVWVGDSPLARPRADAVVLLSAVAATTERVLLGSAVLLPALRHPILLAHQLATLDRLADGRLIVGVGAGFGYPITEAQFVAIGVDFKRRVSRLEETMRVMRLLWTGESVSFDGAHFTFSDVTVQPTPVQEGGPPLWLAGGGAPALRRVGALADGWLPYPPTVAEYASDWDAIGAAAANAGRSSAITPALYATVCIDEEPERARSRLRLSIERYYNAPLELIESIQATFAGSARECASWLTGYIDAGARHIVIRFAVENHRTALLEFAEAVLPALRQPQVAEARS
jgi:probable F420-dependent oxidoreductase